ncbi:MAG: cytochrome-c peroxidase [Hymenobacteraceae bacterium]|nr:cytochrome-c peroxidase [Hymenobacteraceae bacterium]
MLLAGACRPDSDLADDVPFPAGPAVFAPSLPTNLPQAVPSPARNPLTREGVRLGRKLFYDVRLSGTNTIACASCHQPERAFSDGVALSTAGASGNRLRRHVPPLQNMAWAGGLFWDGGAADLESLAFGPLTHPDEMAQDLAGLETELRAVPAYAPLFAAAFPGQTITSVTVARALAQFQRTLITGNSAYDRWTRREPGAVLGVDEQAGLVLGRQKCGPCHAGELFTDFGYHNNGLDSGYADDHERLAWGRGRITNRPTDRGAYKTPTWRNVALTAPYMHDGRFATLDAVLDHYQNHVRESATLDPGVRMADGTPGIWLSEDEKRQLLAFLHALTDTCFTRNPALRE